jgi:hypothetical protein
MTNDIELAKWNKIKDIILTPLKINFNHDTHLIYRLIDINHRVSVQDMSSLHTEFSIEDNKPIYIGMINGVPVEFRESVLIVEDFFVTYVFNDYISYQQNIDYIKEVAKVIKGNVSNKINYKKYNMVYFIDKPYPEFIGGNQNDR